MNRAGMNFATSALTAALLLAISTAANAGARDQLDAFSKGLKEYLAKDPEVFDPKKYSAVGREYVKEYVKSKILVCGSNGKA